LLTEEADYVLSCLQISRPLPRSPFLQRLIELRLIFFAREAIMNL
jgi:hypothetical protein